MKTMKKISALVLAIMMIAVVGLAYGAGDEGRTTPGTAANTYSGSSNTNAITGTGNRIGETTIPITKSIVFTNLNGSAVYEPNITYTYTVTPEAITESTYTVTDSDNHVAYVHPGVTGGVTGVSIQFGTEIGGTATTAVTTSATGTEVERVANLTVDISKFTKPGIYRYKIAETSSPAAVTEAGLTARTNDYNPDRYLDVYIHYVDEDSDSSTPEVLKMYGAVIFKSTTTTAGQDSITTSTVKTTGYEPSATSGDPKDDATVDRYTTYDFSVKKTVSGSMADKQHEFPFYVSISNTITGAKYTYYDDPGTGSGAAETISAAAITKGTNSASSTLTLKDGAYVKFVGVPSNQTTYLTVAVKEYNDTVDAYTPSVSATSGSPTLNSTSAATGSQMTASTGSDTTASFDIVTNDIAAQILTINNSLTEISPTGIVLRFAPYALMLVGGIALLIIAMKRKHRKEEE